MEHLLFLVHRIPYPPNKGDKIRSYHMLRELSRHYRVHLGAFVDDDEDWRHQETVAQYCASCCLLPLSPARATLRSLTGLLRGQALTLPYYHDRRLQEWVGQTRAREGVRKILVYSSSMAQYAEPWEAGVKRVIDFVDIDSDKWAQYARSCAWPKSAIYRREARRLLAYEQAIAGRFDYSFFVSEKEAGLFRELSGLGQDKVGFFDNGVDTAYFRPQEDRASPYDGGERAIVFTGAMDYWANVDAVSWFVEQVMPALRRHCPGLVFYIVGARPTEQVRRLACDDVVVTGRVADVRPYLQHALAVVAPLRIARGVQNKVLEAMAMARPVLASAQALEGIRARPGEEVLQADGAAAYVEHLRNILASPARARALGQEARERVLRDYAWQPCLRTLLEKLD